MTKLTKFILAIALQIFIISVIILFKLYVLGTGTELLLSVKPVDPRSPLRGDYVTFQYDISEVSKYLSYKTKPKNGDTVYVLLRQSGEYWVVNNIELQKPTNGTTFITGKVVSGGEDAINDYSYSYGYNDKLQIVYGVEQYYIPEGKGNNFNFGGKPVSAAVVVDEDGNAVLKRLYVDGKPWP